MKFFKIQQKSKTFSLKFWKKIKKNFFFLGFCTTFFENFQTRNFPKTKKINRPKNFFLERVGKFFEHQDRSKISVRIEWEHSQPLKSTLKHSYGQNENPIATKPRFWTFFVDFQSNVPNRGSILDPRLIYTLPTNC